MSKGQKTNDTYDDKLYKAVMLFWTFLKIGAFTFGGGYAMIPLIQGEVTDKRKWISADDVLDVIAIAESTPGPIAINAATFVGYKVAGALGSLLATVGVVLPSLVIITVISYVLSSFSDLAVVKYAFFGIRAGVLALIVKALISMFKQCQKTAVAYTVMALAFVFAAFTKTNVLIILICCALIGLFSSLLLKEDKTK